MTGLPSTIRAGAADGIAQFDYAYDLAGNLTYRSDDLNGVFERFCFDPLNRLTMEVGQKKCLFLLLLITPDRHMLQTIQGRQMAITACLVLDHHIALVGIMAAGCLIQRITGKPGRQC